jgi:hypothetical protein
MNAYKRAFAEHAALSIVDATPAPSIPEEKKA